MIRPRTVRAKLTLTTTLVMGLVLVALGLLVDFGTDRALRASVDGYLFRQAHSFALDRAARPDGPGAHRGPPDDGPRGPEPPHEGPFGRRPHSANDDAHPHFVRADWGPGSGRSMPGEPPLDAGAFRAALASGQDRRTVTRSGAPFRVYSERVSRGDQALGVVQVGYPMTDVEGTMDDLQRLLLTMVVPMGTLLAGLASLFIVGRALRPVRLIAENARTIGGGNPEERLPVVGDDEFAGLATTLNGMLARLEEAFRLEQATTRRLAATVEQQRRFTADASHEMKTPLSTIKAHAGLLEPQTEDDRESVEAIREAANRMRGLVDDLLVLARADGGQLTARAAPVDLGQAVNAAVGAVSPMPVEVRGAHSVAGGRWWSRATARP